MTNKSNNGKNTNNTPTTYKLSRKDEELLAMASELEGLIYNGTASQSAAARQFVALGENLTFTEYRALKDGWSTYLHTSCVEPLKDALNMFARRITQNRQTF